MRFIKFLLLLVFFFLGLLFFVQNAPSLGTLLKLKIDLFFALPVGDGKTIPLMWEAKEVPFYFVVITAFCVGMAFTVLIFLLSQVRMFSALFSRNRRIKTLEKELARIKASQEKLEAASANAKVIEAAPASPAVAAAPQPASATEAS